MVNVKAEKESVKVVQKVLMFIAAIGTITGLVIGLIKLLGRKS